MKLIIILGALFANFNLIFASNFEKEVLNAKIIELEKIADVLRNKREMVRYYMKVEIINHLDQDIKIPFVEKNFDCFSILANRFTSYGLDYRTEFLSFKETHIIPIKSKEKVCFDFFFEIDKKHEKYMIIEALAFYLDRTYYNKPNRSFFKGSDIFNGRVIAGYRNIKEYRIPENISLGYSIVDNKINFFLTNGELPNTIIAFERKDLLSMSGGAFSAYNIDIYDFYRELLALDQKQLFEHLTKNKIDCSDSSDVLFSVWFLLYEKLTRDFRDHLLVEKEP